MIQRIFQLSVPCSLVGSEGVQSVCVISYLGLCTVITAAHQKKIVILRLCPQILEDNLLPITFHMIPIINHSMADRIVNTISWRLLVRDSFVSNEEIQVFNTAFRG